MLKNRGRKRPIGFTPGVRCFEDAQKRIFFFFCDEGFQGTFLYPNRNFQLQWSRYKRNVPLVSSFRFTRIVSKWKINHNFVVLSTRTISEVASNIFFDREQRSKVLKEALLLLFFFLACNQVHKMFVGTKSVHGNNKCSWEQSPNCNGSKVLASVAHYDVDTCLPYMALCGLCAIFFIF